MGFNSGFKGLIALPYHGNCQSLIKCVQTILKYQWKRGTKKEKNEERIKVERVSKKNNVCEDTMFEAI